MPAAVAPKPGDTAPTVLLVEDDIETAAIIDAHLVAAGYRVLVARDGPSGLAIALSSRPNAIILDRSLPGLEGLELLGRLRNAGALMPALVLSARGGVRDRVEGFEAGADDYLIKPFALAELLARLKVMLRRSLVADAVQLVAGPLVLDLLTREVRRDGVLVLLQPKELRLLEELMRHAGTFVPRALLLERVWNFQFDPHTKIVETHMSRLRAKLNLSGPDLIETQRSAGYRIKP